MESSEIKKYPDSVLRKKASAIKEVTDQDRRLLILKAKGSGKMEEGCLSIPGVGVIIDRPDEVIVSGLNEKGKWVEIEAHGLLARVLQHEIDHLSGKLIIDYLNLLEKFKLKLHARRKIAGHTEMRRFAQTTEFVKDEISY